MGKTPAFSVYFNFKLAVGCWRLEVGPDSYREDVHSIPGIKLITLLSLTLNVLNVHPTFNFKP